MCERERRESGREEEKTISKKMSDSNTKTITSSSAFFDKETKQRFTKLF